MFSAAVRIKKPKGKDWKAVKTIHYDRYYDSDSDEDEWSR